MARTTAGTRVRELRRQAGLTQKALASAIEISPSYLNLIEHNQRALTPSLVTKLAHALDTEAEHLSERGQAHLIDQLTAALADVPGELGRGARADAFVSRFPDWARVLAYQVRRNRDLEDSLTALSDRMTHDPFLSETLHGMLSNITAIKAGAEILYHVRDLGPEQEHRFRRSLFEESSRVSEMSQQLANYLAHNSEISADAVTPEEALESLLQRHDWAFDALDTLASALANPHGDEAQRRFDEGIDELLLDAGFELGSDGAGLARGWLRQYARDAVAMPLLAFHAAGTELGWDPVALAARFGQPVHGVMRRLAGLNRPRLPAPQMGLVLVNAAGHPLYRRPLPEFALPRHGNFCTLWPLFEAFTRPGQVALGRIALGPKHGFDTISIALPRAGGDLSAPQDHVAGMLFAAQEDSAFHAVFPEGPRTVGASCRICAQASCTARTAPNILA